MAQYPDFVIRCDHGNRGGKADVVQRFRWMESQGHWIPVRTKASRMTMLRGDSPNDWWHFGDDDRRPLRVHLEIVCATSRCRNKVAADDKTIQHILAIMAVARPPFSMFLMHVDNDRNEITLSLDALRLALKYRNQLDDTQPRQADNGS